MRAEIKLKDWKEQLRNPKKVKKKDQEIDKQKRNNSNGAKSKRQAFN